ncbi:MAG: hypothetical protein RR334_03505, partial [Clostridia bacterium]
RKSEYREKIEKEKEKIISVGQCPKNNGTMSQKQWDNVPPYIYNSNYISNTNNIVNTNIEDNNINNSNIHSELVSKFIPPTIEDIILYAKSKGREDLAHKFYEFYDAGHWVDSQGLIVSNWKQRFISWKNKNDKRIENTTNYKTTDLDRYRRE